MGRDSVLRSLGCTLALTLLSSLGNALGDVVQVDLSGVASGTYLDGIGADFTASFTGQSASGTLLSGTPSSPLSLTPSQSLTVSNYSGSPSILPTPSNQGPLCVLLEENATSLRWRMGHASTGSTVTIDLYSNAGQVVHSTTLSMLGGYNDYELADVPPFRGVAFHNNNDPAGVRFMLFEYDSIGGLSADVNQISLVAGGVQNLSLEAPVEYAGEVYVLLGSASGTDPGLSMGGRIKLPLNADPYFIHTLTSPNHGHLGQSVGQLDPVSASAHAWVQIPPHTDPNLAGVTLHHAFVVVKATPTLISLPYTSPAAPLLFLP